LNVLGFVISNLVDCLFTSCKSQRSAGGICTYTLLSRCGLDLNLALSGCKFGVDGRTILPALLRRPQLELHLITVVIAKSEARVNKRASQAHSHGFSNTRQTYVPKAPISSPICSRWSEAWISRPYWPTWLCRFCLQNVGIYNILAKFGAKSLHAGW